MDRRMMLNTNPFGVFDGGIAIIQSDHLLKAHWTSYACARSRVAGRASMRYPILNKNYVITVTDNTKYSVICRPITSLTRYSISQTTYIDGYGYLSNSQISNWSDQSSVNTEYVWITLKKNDNSDFTDDELADGAANVIRFTEG